MSEDIETSEDRIRKAIGIILTRQNSDEILFFQSAEGMRFLHVRHATDSDGNYFVWLLFKRTPEIKPYYAAIKSWSESSNLSWSDKTHDGDQYICIKLEPHADELCRHITSANEHIFKFREIYAGTQNTNLSLALKDINHPFLIAFSALALIVGMGLLPIYELFRIPSISTPSVQALDWPEVFLIGIIVTGIIALRYATPKKRKSIVSQRKRILARLLLLFVIALTFFTY